MQFILVIARFAAEPLRRQIGMGLHLAAWLVLLFCSINSLVLEFGGIYSHPIRYLSFGPYSDRQQVSQAGDSASANGSSAGAAAAAEAAAAVSLRRKRGIASGLNSIDDIAALSPQLSWYYNWGTQPVSVLPLAEWRRTLPALTFPHQACQCRHAVATTSSST